MRERLDEKYTTTSNIVGLKQIIQTANEIKDMFAFTPVQLDECVEIVKDKLQELLTHNPKYWNSSFFKTMELYTQENGRTKTVTFMIDSTNRQAIKILSGEVLNSPEDYQSIERINNTMKEFRRQNILKQAKSRQDAKKVFIS